MSEPIREPRDDDDRVYPCVRCGLLRSKNEGGTTFTVCDECWESQARQGDDVLKRFEDLVRRAHELEEMMRLLLEKTPLPDYGRENTTDNTRDFAAK